MERMGMNDISMTSAEFKPGRSWAGKYLKPRSDGAEGVNFLEEPQEST